MSEEKVVDVEVVETPETAEAAPAMPPSLTKIVDETAKVMESLGKALIKAAQDVSNLMVVPVDKVTRAQLDLLVEAGVAETRSKAAASLLKETVQSRQEIFNKIEKTRSQIETLKQQLHTLVGSPS
jgi:cell division septum initiation protein DivIVA